MKQISFASTGFELSTKRTRKRAFLEEMDRVIPWSELLALITPHAPAGKTGRPPFAVEVMLRIYLLQQFFGHSDPAMEEALHDIPLYREFARLDAGITRLPDESTILRFRHLLEAHDLGTQILATVNAVLAQRGLLLKTGTVVDATLIAAPSSTKNSSGTLGQVEALDVTPESPPAKVVIDARSGTVVLGQNVTLGACAVAHGNLSVTISTQYEVSQPNPLGAGQTAVVPKTDVKAKADKANLLMFNPGVTLEAVVRALNAVGAAPSDLIAILQAMKAAGALHAQLDVI
ncbi:MAG: IS5 family transposase [Thiomonas sp.]